MASGVKNLSLRGRSFALCAALIAASGCSAAIPPKELVDARASYTRAAQGSAASLAPAQLDTAKQALSRAEGAFNEDAESQQARDLAYIADRKAREAEAAAALQQAQRDKAAAEDNFKELSQQQLATAKDALQSGQQQIERERQARAQAESARLQAESARSQAESARSVAEKGRQEAEAARREAERVANAALASLKEIAAVKEEKRGVVITLSGAVLFASGKSELLPIAKEKLNQVATTLKDQGSPPMRIEGHTDSTGSAQANRKLSLDRADSVKAHLVSVGLPADKISTVGHGPDRAVAENSSAEGRANNRRVEIIVNPTSAQ
ncbi:OmpA family protein [Sorangium sp. So ce887]|uniref:OmpA family protein n=1 Tax=Sorangium sp. So ce887 TaxID=3133324 RepID=UPI003F5E8493